MGTPESLEGLETPPSLDKTEVEGKLDWRGRPATKDKHGGHYNSLFILAFYGFDSFATLALAVNIVTYFTDVMHFGADDATKVLVDFVGTSYILTIVAAYLSDAFVARYKVILISALLEIVGLFLLTMQAKSPTLKPTPCNLFDPTSVCTKVHGRDSAFLYISIYLIAIGMAGIKACVPTHGADQFDEKDPREAKQMSSYFNWLLLSASIGAVVSLTFIVWLQTHKTWSWGFGVSAIGSFVGTIIFIVGIPRYRVHAIPKSDAITCVIKVYIAALRNWKLQLPAKPEELYEIEAHGDSAKEAEFLPHSSTFRFLDKAAIKTEEPPSSWKLCRVTHVESAKIILGMIPIFITITIMYVLLIQFETYSINQGITMDNHIKTFEVAPTPFLPYMFMIILIPYDRLLVPFARRLTSIPTGITHFQRVGIGMILSCMSMAIAAMVEVKRKNTAKNSDMIDAIPIVQLLPISFFWLTFQYAVYGVAQVFIFVGLLEFFYSEAPRDLKSSATCFLWSAIAVGYFLSTEVVKWVNHATADGSNMGGWLVGYNLNRNDLNLYYWTLAVISFINFLNFLFWAKWYKYRSKNNRVKDECVV